jgi:hypothetical protein
MSKSNHHSPDPNDKARCKRQSVADFKSAMVAKPQDTTKLVFNVIYQLNSCSQGWHCLLARKAFPFSVLRPEIWSVFKCVMGRANSSYIDNSLAIDCAFWIYNHDRLFNITHDQIHMSVICLDSKSERFLGMIKGENIREVSQSILALLAAWQKLVHSGIALWDRTVPVCPC